MQQQGKPGVELMQIAATLAAGMLSSRNPQSWSPDLDRNAAYAAEVYPASGRSEQARPVASGARAAPAAPRCAQRQIPGRTGDNGDITIEDGDICLSSGEEST
jgi:hypothetical protein